VREAGRAGGGRGSGAFAGRHCCGRRETDSAPPGPVLPPRLSPAQEEPGGPGLGARRAARPPPAVFGRRGMDRYRYFVFNQRSMVGLGLLQTALSALCVGSGFVDGVFRAESPLGNSRAPVWAGMVRPRRGFWALLCGVPLPVLSVGWGEAGTACQLFPGFLLGTRIMKASLSWGGQERASGLPSEGAQRSAFLLGNAESGA